MSLLPLESVDEALAPDPLLTLDDLALLHGRRARRRRRLHDRGWLLRRTLATADVAAVALAFLVARVLLGAGPLTPLEVAGCVAALPLWVLLGKIAGLYDADEGPVYRSTLDEVPRIFSYATAGTWLAGVGGLLLGTAPALRELALFWVLAVPLVGFGRAAARSASRQRIEYLQSTVIVGAGDVGQQVARKLLLHPEYGLRIVGFVDGNPRRLHPDLAGLPVLGAPDELPRIVDLLDVDRVVIAFSNESHEEVLDLIRSLRDLNVLVDIVPRLFDLMGPGVHLHDVEALPLIGLSKLHLSRSSRALKRALDVAVSLTALSLAAPVLAAAAVAIKLGSPGPVFFRQTRIGAGGRPFRLLKLRTMVVGADERKGELAHLNVHARPGGDPRMFKIRHDPRVTPVGKLLRRYFLDELPQLVNVLRGEMSLIGPRPLIVEEDRHVDAWGRRRLDLKPGMTGVWQVLGRSSISFEEMVRLDYLYVTGWSLGTDLRLLARTVPLVLRGDAEV